MDSVSPCWSDWPLGWLTSRGLVIVCRGYGTLHIDSVLLLDCASLWFTDCVLLSWCVGLFWSRVCLLCQFCRLPDFKQSTTINQTPSPLDLSTSLWMMTFCWIGYSLPSDLGKWCCIRLLHFGVGIWCSIIYWVLCRLRLIRAVSWQHAPEINTQRSFVVPGYWWVCDT